MSSNDNRFLPTWNEFRNIFNENWFSENSSIQYISNCAIGALPHLFKIEFFDSSFIRSNCSTFDSYFALLDSIGSIDGNLIISFIPILHSKIKILDINVKEGIDQMIFDGLPDDPGHFISVKFGNRVSNLDFLGFHILSIMIISK